MRKMATIRTIASIQPIPEADKIEMAVVDGWQCVVEKGKYREGEAIIYCEVDSFIPSSIASHLTPAGHYPKKYTLESGEEIEGEVLRTRKFKGQISQGLVLPLYEHPAAMTIHHSTHPLGVEGVFPLDVSEALGIVKYEPPVSAQLQGQVKGNFPSCVPKTDEERVQNLVHKLEGWRHLQWEVSEKLEGSSMTAFLGDWLDSSFELCSHKWSLKETEGNTFWSVARKQQLEEKMRNGSLNNIAIQGELIGESIQKNIYGLVGHDFRVYKMYDSKKGTYLSPQERAEMLEELGLKGVPVLDPCFSFGHIEGGKEAILAYLLQYAEGKSVLNPKQEREGVVLKCLTDSSLSFKIISNKYLMKQKGD